MLSRFTRIAAMSSQIGGGLSLLRDDRTAPKVSLGPLGADHHFYNDHAPYCKSALPRLRTTSFGNDPFMGTTDSGMNDFGPFEVSPDIFANDETTSKFSWLERFGPIAYEEPKLDMDGTLLPNEFVEAGSVCMENKDWMKSYIVDPFKDSLPPMGSIVDFTKLDDEKSPGEIDTEFNQENVALFDFSEMKQEIKEEVDDFSDFCSTEDGESYGKLVPYSCVKRRGVKLKPKSDDMTNRRRAMNREAALRYRERRRDRDIRFRMYYLQLERRNKELKKIENKMMEEVAYYEKLLQDKLDTQ